VFLPNAFGVREVGFATVALVHRNMLWKKNDKKGGGGGN
jgi:hypothetical protein